MTKSLDNIQHISGFQRLVVLLWMILCQEWDIFLIRFHTFHTEIRTALKII